MQKQYFCNAYHANRISFYKDVTGKYCPICYLDIQLIIQKEADAVNDL